MPGLVHSSNVSSTAEAVALGLQRLEAVKKPFLAGEANSTEAVLDAARAILLAGGRDQDRALAFSSNKEEKASDFVQRVMWAEVSIMAWCGESGTVLRTSGKVPTQSV